MPLISARSFRSFTGLFLWSLALLRGSLALSAGLAGELSSQEIKSAVKSLSLGSQHHAFTAAAIPNDELGLDLGIEASFLFRRDLLDQGDGTAIIPRIIPLPRLWAMWDLPREFQVSASFTPGFLFDGISTAGMGLQWVWARLPDMDTALSVLGDYTLMNAFGDLRSNTIGLSVQASRDLQVWQPFVGLGVLMAGGSVRESLTAPGVKSGTYLQPALNFYFGARVDLLAKLSFQMNLVNTQASLSGLMQMSF